MQLRVWRCRAGFSHANSEVLAVFETVRRPPLPSGSLSWPLAPGPEAVSSPLLGHSMDSVCVCVCVNGQSQKGFCHSVISFSATSLNITGCQPLAQGESSVFKRQQTVIFPSIFKILLISLMLNFSIYFLKVTSLVNISHCLAPHPSCVLGSWNYYLSCFAPTPPSIQADIHSVLGFV